MRRLAFNVFVILSLLVFVISVCIWVRSYFVADNFNGSCSERVGEKNRQTIWGAGSSRGRIWLILLRVQGPSDGELDYHQWKHRAGPPWDLDGMFSEQPEIRLLGFAWWHEWQGPDARLDYNRFTKLVVPLWLFLPAAVPPLLWLRRRWRTLGPGFPITPASLD